MKWSFIYSNHSNLYNFLPIWRLLSLWRFSPDWEISFFIKDYARAWFSQLGVNLPIGRISPFLDISPSCILQGCILVDQGMFSRIHERFVPAEILSFDKYSNNYLAKIDFLFPILFFHGWRDHNMIHSSIV